MADDERTRLVAWSRELAAVHTRLRDAVRATKSAATDGTPGGPAPRDLLLFCLGLCTALTGHHQGEDRELFPAIAAAHPQLRGTLRKLEQDHAAIARLVADLQAATERPSTPAELDRHVDGIAAILESHFRYEERELLAVLDDLDLAADPRDVLGPR